MIFNWQKQGMCFSISDFNQGWMESHTQLAIPYIKDNGDFRIFFNSRTNGKSRPTFIDIDSESMVIRHINPNPLLDIGKPGTFDDSGVMFSCLLKHNGLIYMYYSGWNESKSVSYHNSIGLAISHDNGNTFERYSSGPIIDRQVHIPIMAAGPYVIENDDELIMYFLSCSEWIKGTNKMEPVYDIHFATSNDGINWHLGKDNTCIQGVNESIAQPCVIKLGNKYYMWYSYRKTLDYRSNPNNSYRIGFAESNDGKHFTRKDNLAGIDIADSGWDSIMIEYPYVIRHNDMFYMFYNGNGFGQSGVGYATCPAK